MLMASVVSCRKLIHSKQSDLGLNIRCGSILALTFYSLAGLLAMVLLLIVLLILGEHIDPYINPYFIITFYLWCLGRLCMNGVFIARLRKAFKDTPFAYPLSTYRTLWSILIIHALIITVNTVLMALVFHFWWTDLTANDNNVEALPVSRTGVTMIQIGTYSVGLQIILDIVFSSFLSYLFGKNILKLIQFYYNSYTKYIANKYALESIKDNEL